MAGNVLVIVDVQNDFVPGGALPVPGGDQVVDVINPLQKNFELVVATQDWHPANHVSFASNHPGNKPGDSIMLHGRPEILWPDHCVQNTRGAALVAGLNTRRLARVFQKGTDPEVDSYSGFFDNDRRHATGLADFLKSQGITDVYVCGLATDHCVRATALDSRELGFRTHLLADACRGVNLKHGDVDRAIEAMRTAGVLLE